jgi:hypothetical protein
VRRGTTWLIGIALGVVDAAAGSCASHVAGITVDVSVMHVTAAPAPDGSPRTFDTYLGYHVTITRGYSTVSAVDLLACTPAMPRREEDRSILHVLLFGGGGVAEAHTPGPWTHLGAPMVDTLLRQDGTATPIGQILPPPASYCGLKATFAPADRDAHGLPQDVDMTGRTIYLEGTWIAPSGGAATPFTISSDATAQVTLALDPQLVLDMQHESGAVLLTSRWDHWLDQVDFATMDDAARAQALLDSLPSTITADVQL